MGRLMFNKRPVCMITGLGEGTGGFTARRFAKAGYRIAMLARTKERLDMFEKRLMDLKVMYVMFLILTR